jgi:hypothetical protein
MRMTSGTSRSACFGMRRKRHPSADFCTAGVVFWRQKAAAW